MVETYLKGERVPRDDCMMTMQTKAKAITNESQFDEGMDSLARGQGSIGDELFKGALTGHQLAVQGAVTGVEGEQDGALPKQKVPDQLALEPVPKKRKVFVMDTEVRNLSALFDSKLTNCKELIAVVKATIASAEDMAKAVDGSIAVPGLPHYSTMMQRRVSFLNIVEGDGTAKEWKDLDIAKRDSDSKLVLEFHGIMAAGVDALEAGTAGW